MEKKTCPYCGEEIMATAKKCKHCGEWLEAEPVESEQTVPQTATIQSQPVVEEPEAESEPVMSEEDTKYYDRGFIPFYSERIWKLYRFTSSGSVSRGEYWKFALITGIVMYFAVNLFSLVLNFLSLSGLGVDYLTSRWIYMIFVIVACIGVTITCTCMVIRRLHDTGKSGWLSILGFIPLVNIILLVFLCQKGEAVDPKAKAKAKDYILLIGSFIVSIFIYMVNIGMTMQDPDFTNDIENVSSGDVSDSEALETIDNDTYLEIPDEDVDGLDAYDDISDCKGFYYIYFESFSDNDEPMGHFSIKNVDGKVVPVESEIYRSGYQITKVGYKNGLLRIEWIDESTNENKTACMDLVHTEVGNYEGYVYEDGSRKPYPVQVIRERLNI